MNWVFPFLYETFTVGVHGKMVHIKYRLEHLGIRCFQLVVSDVSSKIANSIPRIVFLYKGFLIEVGLTAESNPKLLSVLDDCHNGIYNKLWQERCMISFRNQSI